MDVLTDKQARVFKAIINFAEVESRPPTIQELADSLSCHVKTVYQYILVLERKEYIERRKGRIHIPEHLRHDPGIPIVGQVAAGCPILAIENITDYLPIAEMYRGKKNLFALQVRGDSMTGAHICNDDYVIVRQQPRVENGQIGVAFVNDEVTVKRIYISKRKIKLISENPDYPPMVFNATDNDIRIVGKVVGVFRTLK
ncbi:transcriptional repressor LexA [Planctomycetota bacterium]